MPHHKHHEKLEQLKQAIQNSEKIGEEEKKNALEHIEEWYEEDKAFGTLLETLVEKFEPLETVLADLGLI